MGDLLGSPRVAFLFVIFFSVLFWPSLCQRFFLRPVATSVPRRLRDNGTRVEPFILLRMAWGTSRGIDDVAVVAKGGRKKIRAAPSEPW